MLLAGDAGGFVNGITAEGIFYAMVSGDLAGRAAAAGSTAGYERAGARRSGAELRDAVLVQRHLLTTPGRIDGLLEAARRAPDVADLLVRYVMGEVSYAAARRRLLIHSPVLGIRLLATAVASRVARPASPLPAGQDDQPLARVSAPLARREAAVSIASWP